VSGIAVSEYPMKAAATATAPCLTPPDQSDTAAPSISWNREFCHGAWVLSSYADVSAALRDPRFSVRRSGRWIEQQHRSGAHSRTQESLSSINCAHSSVSCRDRCYFSTVIPIPACGA